MRKQILICAGITLVVLRVLYELRLVTFVVWTNAAMISRSYPLLTVGAIEIFLTVGIFGAVYVIYKLVESIE